MKDSLSEEELVEYVKPRLKAKGFLKKNKWWSKDIGDFTLYFYIQGSSYSKEDYYIRPCISINAVPTTPFYRGHFHTQIEITTPEEILSRFEFWCEEWTNKSLIKERLIKFIEWEKRNPLEKRRAGLVDYDADPVPAHEFFQLSVCRSDPSPQQYILDNF